MRTSKIIVYTIILFIFLGSCKIFKRGTTGKKVLSLEQLYDSTLHSQPNYKTLDARINVKYKAGQKSMSVKGNLRMISDSLIWISLRALGFEAVRLKFTKDSIFLMDRLKKGYTIAKYDYLSKIAKVDVDYNSLQSILTNQFFIFPKVDENRNGFISEFKLMDDTSKIETYRKTDLTVENLIKFEPISFLVKEYLINDIPNMRSMQITYTKGEFAGATNFPKQVDIISNDKGKPLTVNLTYTKVGINGKVSFPFKVPDSYKTYRR